MGKVCGDWKKANITTVFMKGEKVLGIYRLASLTLIPVKMMEQILLETVIKHRKDK